MQKIEGIDGVRACKCAQMGGDKMLNLVVFETEEELCELTGLTEHEIIDIGLGKEYNKLNKMDLIYLKR